jgi:exopolyphosphatase/guanosine-5'-triphosphate,3'-diphosphate pyrophosphatase
MRVAVVDIGSNSTRLLIADVRDGQITERDRRSNVTRLGEGVDANGRLGEEPIARVHKVLEEYAAAIEDADCDAKRGVLTSAVRDADNGADFTQQVGDRYGIDASTIDGDTEAQLTFRGATAGRDAADERPALVIDIGGGSTEFVVGARGEVSFHVSTQLGVVRQSERHLHDDPPPPDQLARLTDDLRAILGESIPATVREHAVAAIAVAGTATTAAAIGLELDPYDPARVEGHVLTLGFLEMLLARLAAMTVAERRKVVGLHPDRAPTIIAGVAILIEALRAFGLEEVDVSEHDLLYGVALEAAGS